MSLSCKYFVRRRKLIHVSICITQITKVLKMKIITKEVGRKVETINTFH